MLEAIRRGPAQGAAQQLVVLLHGVGANGQDLIDLAASWSPALPHAAFVSFDAPEPYDGAPFGRQWFSLADRTPAAVAAGARRAMPVLLAAIEAERARLGLPGRRVAIMGFSQGAMMALFAGLQRDPAPAAVLAYSGALLAFEPANYAPVLLVHGEVDEVVPWQRGRDAERDLRAMGVPVETVWCPGLGHGIDAAGLSAGGLFLQRSFALAE